MVSHILVNNASRNINRFIIIDSQKHLWKTFERILKFIETVVHETKMESTTDEMLVEIQSLMVHVYGPFN